MARTVPPGFFGMMADGPLTDQELPLAPQLRRMRRAGVETVRVVFDWSDAQPYATRDAVPTDQQARFAAFPNDVPTDFSRTDAFVRAAARAGLRVLPVVLRAPDWDSQDPLSYGGSPLGEQAYAAYVGALVRRYGRAGSFWSGGRPGPRITAWQIWNEPSLGAFWTAEPWPSTYATLLRAAGVAVHAADPKARVVVGGLTNGGSAPAWEGTRALYAAGAKGAFDVLALHPYTGTVAGVVETIRRSRAVMRQYGDDLPVFVTETSFSSSGGHTPDDFATWDRTEAGQAVAVRQLMTALMRKRKAMRIQLVSWYTWVSPDVPGGTWSSFAGLNRLSRGAAVPKPALAAYARVARRAARTRR